MAHPLPSAADTQAEIRRLRRNLLGGRGPGAGPAEVLAHTRLRGEIAGTPVPALLATTERRAAEARAARHPAQRRPMRAAGAVCRGLAVVVVLAVAVSAVRRLRRRRWW